MFSIPILLIFLHFQSSYAARNDTLIFEIDVFCGYPNSTLHMTIQEYDYLSRNDPIIPIHSTVLRSIQTHFTFKGFQDGDEKKSRGYEWIVYILHNCNYKAQNRKLKVYDREDKVPFNQDTRISFLIDLTNFDKSSLGPIVHYEKIEF